MVRTLTTRCLTAAGVLVLLGTASCKALFFDLDAVQLQSADTSAADTETSPPPPDTSDADTTGTDTTGTDTTDADTTQPPEDGGDTDRDTTATDTAPRDTNGGETSTEDTTSSDTAPESDGDTSSSPSPTSSCLAVASCAYLKCPDLDDKCVDAAVQYGESSARQAAKNVLQCTETNNCDYYFRPSCVETHCSSGSDTCLGAEPKGSGWTCFEIVNCRRQCPDNDSSCPPDCKDNGSFFGQRKFGSLKTCINDHCQTAQPGMKDDCLRTECAAEFKKCMGCP